jgi:NTE family protein
MIAVIMSGGVGLGAYHAGVYETLSKQGLEPSWLAGSSIGAVTAALLAGSPAGERMKALQSFWQADFGTIPARAPGSTG